VHGRGGDNSVRAGSVLHHHSRIPDRSQLVGDDAREQIGRAARRKSDQDFDRPVRKVGLGLSGKHQHQEG